MIFLLYSVLLQVALHHLVKVKQTGGRKILISITLFMQGILTASNPDTYYSKWFFSAQLTRNKLHKLLLEKQEMKSLTHQG